MIGLYCLLMQYASLGVLDHNHTGKRYMNEEQLEELKRLEGRVRANYLKIGACVFVIALYVIAAAWGWITHDFFYDALPLQAFFATLMWSVVLFILQGAQRNTRRKISLLKSIGNAPPSANKQEHAPAPLGLHEPESSEVAQQTDYPVLDVQDIEETS
jgi:hypothetical protein